MVTVATLQDDPFSLVALSGLSNTASAAFGPSPNGVPVTSNIGIQLRFSLTAGDSASILSRFDVLDPIVRVPDAGSSAALVAIAVPLFYAMRRGVKRRLR
jgi:hypothetical protein